MNVFLQTVGTGYITASGRSSNDSNWYVIDSSTVQGSGSVYLGRPWRDYARVVFQSTSLGSNVCVCASLLLFHVVPLTRLLPPFQSIRRVVHLVQQVRTLAVSSVSTAQAFTRDRLRCRSTPK